MKRFIALFLAMVLMAGMLSGCTGTTVVNNYYYNNYYGDSQGGADQETKPQHTPKGGLKTGLAMVTSVKTTDAAADAEGAIEYTVDLVAVLVDDQGVIADCIIDSIGATVKFNATGTITSDVTAAIATKNEQGDDYGMVAWGGAIAEWYEQADALAQYCVGKTIDQVLTGYSEDADLATSATIYLGGYVQAISVAVQNAKDLGAQAGDELKLASMSSLKSSADNAAQLDVDAVAMTMKDDVITSCYLDSLQAKATMDENGVATVGNTKTKNEQGDDYGMVAWGGAKYEWYQQAENFCKYVTGKTAKEVAGISVNESTYPADGTDLATSVTIAIGGFQALIAKAAQ